MLGNHSIPMDLVALRSSHFLVWSRGLCPGRSSQAPPPWRAAWGAAGWPTARPGAEGLQGPAWGTRPLNFHWVKNRLQGKQWGWGPLKGSLPLSYQQDGTQGTWSGREAGCHTANQCVTSPDAWNGHTENTRFRGSESWAGGVCILASIW